MRSWYDKPVNKWYKAVIHKIKLVKKHNDNSEFQLMNIQGCWKAWNSWSLFYRQQKLLIIWNYVSSFSIPDNRISLTNITSGCHGRWENKWNITIIFVSSRSLTRQAWENISSHSCPRGHCTFGHFKMIMTMLELITNLECWCLLFMRRR